MDAKRFEEFVTVLRSYDKENPIRSFLRINDAFYSLLSKKDREEIEPEYFAGLYNEKYKEPIDGFLIDIVALIKLMFWNPEQVFEEAHLFTNATKLVLGFIPDYGEADVLSTYSYLVGYLVLTNMRGVFTKDVLGYNEKTGAIDITSNDITVPLYTLSPLSTDVADVIALAVDRDGLVYFPDKRVINSLEVLNEGNSVRAFEIKKADELFSEQMLPKTYSAKTEKGFEKALLNFIHNNEEVLSKHAQIVKSGVVILFWLFDIINQIRKPVA